MNYENLEVLFSDGGSGIEENLPAEGMRQLDYQMIEELVQNTRNGFEQLLKTLDPNKYPKARTYLTNLYQHTMTFLDYWLQTQQWLPLNINAIESAFSRIANRIIKIGKGWSDQGLLGWLMLALKKIFKPELWTQLKFWSFSRLRDFVPEF